MHICFLTCEYPPLPSGGIGTSVQNLARSLAKSGHRVSVVGWGRTAQFDDNGVQVRFLRSDHPPKAGWLLNRLRVQKELRRMVAEEDLAIVEAPDWSGFSAGLRPGCPLVIRCHGSAVYFGSILGEKVRRSVRWAEQMALRGADGVAAVSRFTAGKTSDLFGLGDAVRVIRNAIDWRRFEPGSPPEVNLRSILYFGAVVRKKGVLDLCRAFSQVIDAVPDATLQIAGADSADSRTRCRSTWALCQQVLSPKARARTCYAGAVPYAEVIRYLHKASVCVFPSYAEALPLAWLEAMACSRPVIAYDIGWAREVVVPGKTGVLTAAGRCDLLAHEMIRLLKAPENAARLGEAGRRRIQEEFSVERAAAESIDWYKGVIEATERGSTHALCEGAKRSAA